VERNRKPNLVEKHIKSAKKKKREWNETFTEKPAEKGKERFLLVAIPQIPVWGREKNVLTDRKEQGGEKEKTGLETSQKKKKRHISIARIMEENSPGKSRGKQIKTLGNKRGKGKRRLRGVRGPGGQKKKPLESHSHREKKKLEKPRIIRLWDGKGGNALPLLGGGSPRQSKKEPTSL